MPALNIIAIHARFVNSGSESSLPSRIRPKRLIASTTHMTRNTSAAITNSQAKLFSTQARAVLDAVSKELLPSAAQATTARTEITPMATTVRSGVPSSGPSDPHPGNSDVPVPVNPRSCGHTMQAYIRI